MDIIRDKAPHQGRNVKRIREILGIKQEALAISLGISQQAISLLEQKENLDALTLDKVSKVLGVSQDSINNFSEEATVTIISNNYHDHASSIQYNFNPIDKWLEALEENKKLYERLLQAEKEKNEILEKLVSLMG